MYSFYILDLQPSKNHLCKHIYLNITLITYNINIKLPPDSLLFQPSTQDMQLEDNGPVQVLQVVGQGAIVYGVS